MDKIQIAVEIENVDTAARIVLIEDDDVGLRLGVKRSLAVDQGVLLESTRVRSRGGEHEG